MNFRKLYYLSHNGGYCNFQYSLKAYTREYTLRRFTRRMLNSELKKLDEREDCDYILKCIDYYNKFEIIQTQKTSYGRSEIILYPHSYLE
jgi:hypothetical protein